MSELISAYDELLRAIRTTRRRWKLKILLRGLAVVLASGFCAFAISVWAMDRFHYSEGAVSMTRVLIWIALVALVARFLVLPLSRSVTDRQVSLYIEENEPNLQAELLSAVELGAEAKRKGDDTSGQATSAHLLTRLLEQAIMSCQALDYGATIERSGLRRFSALTGLVTLVAAGAILLFPAFLQHGALLLFLPWKGAALENPYSIDVVPGDITLARGSDQEVRAQLLGFDTEAVELALRRGDGSWERWPMASQVDDPVKIFMMLDLQDASEYYVEAEGVRSDLYRIEVADLPYVARLDLEYRFPAYTGLEPQRIEDGGDIAVLRGTEVLLEITPTVPTEEGQIVLEGDGEELTALALEAREDGLLLASLTVESEAFYSVELRGPTGDMLRASAEYAIEVLEDQPPIISIVEPGRDVRAHKLEEIFAEVKAEDDHGLARVDLIYSVNGEEEQTVTLLGGKRRPKEIEGGHTFYLEELDLQDGDFIAYYATARDVGDASQRRDATTDIYFVEISPFTKNYRQAQQQGGGAGGGGEMGNALSQRQRQIIAATFKLVRDKDEYTSKDFAENLTTVALMQGRLRAQVDNLIGRMENRLRGEDEFQKIVDNLQQASAEMEPAQAQLSALRPEDALPPEQRSLKFLQRAEATFRDVQVSFQRGGGGGGGEAQRMAEDLADLFELELDKLHNQYETVQRGERQALQEEVDEALQKLKELAKRQEQENERARRLASQMGLSGAAGGNQRDLVKETEELARKLERLAREQSRADLKQTARRLQSAADAMRKAMAHRSAGEVAGGGDALEELKRARRLLEKNRDFQLAAEMDDLESRARRAEGLQQEISSQVGQLDPTGERGSFVEAVENILEKKDELAKEIADLENQIDQVARQARRTQKDASRGLSEASESIRENQLKEKIRYSKGVVRGRSPEYAQGFEGEISSDIEEMSGRLAEAKGAMGTSPDDREAAALESARELVRRLESFEERLQDRGERRGEEGGQEQAQQGSERGDQQGGEQNGESEGSSGEQSGGGGERRLAERGGQQSESGEPSQSGGQKAARGGATSRMGQGGPGWYQPGIFTPEDLRQMGAAFDRRLADAEELQSELRDQGISSRDLAAVLERMKEFSVRGLNQDPLALESLRSEIIEGLRQFEYRLWRDLEGDSVERLYLAGADEVPAGYRDLVESYYRELSESE